MKPASSLSSVTPASLCFAALLVVTLLFAQWMGLQHRIEHADHANAHAVAQAVHHDWPDTPLEYAGDKSHSCTLFDGMALADSTAALPFIPLLQTSVQVLALWAAHASWDAPFLAHFSSRAPPAA